jgi:hypothetical protein
MPVPEGGAIGMTLDNSTGSTAGLGYSALLDTLLCSQRGLRVMVRLIFGSTTHLFVPSFSSS